MSRRAHLVGAWPGRNPEHAMEVALEHLAPYLDRMTDGETGDRSLWITPAVDRFRANPDVEIVRDGDWSTYENTAMFKVRDGASLNPDNIGLRSAHHFEASFPSFKAMRDRVGRPDLRFQVGIIAPVDLVVSTFGPAGFGDPSLAAAFATATLGQVERIHEIGGDDVVFQLETVAALIAVAQAPDDEQTTTAAQLAEPMLELVRRTPKGTRWGMHLCLGDFHHTSMAGMRNVRPLVLLANALAAGWPEDRPLDFIHAPFAAAAEPPVAEESWYEPLTELSLPDDVRFVAGFLHETLDHDAHRELLERIERLTGRQVDIAAACGLGRRDTAEEAFEAMRETAALIDETKETRA